MRKIADALESQYNYKFIDCAVYISDPLLYAQAAYYKQRCSLSF